MVWVDNGQNVIESPDFDGTYGENPHGVFWFTPDGTYMEWNGNYFISDLHSRGGDLR